MRALWIGCIALSLMLSGAVVRAEDSLKFGVFPYVSPAKLVEHHGALVQYLQQRLGQRVQLVSSPDFKSFLAQTANKKFDLILTAPHFGRLAEVKDGYRRVAMTSHHVQGVYLVRPNSPIKTIADLKGKTITIAAPTSIVYRMAQRQMREDYGLVDGRNITIINTRTHNNAMYSVIKGESDASVTGVNLYLGLVKRQGPVVRKIGETPKVPGFMLMANPALSASKVKKIRQTVEAFSSTEAGQHYIFKSYTDIDDKTMSSLDAYITDLR